MSAWVFTSDMNVREINRRGLLRQTGAWGLGAGALLHAMAHAAVFMDTEQAQGVLMPDVDAFQSVSILFGESELATIRRITQTAVPRRFAPKVWEGMAGGKGVGWFMLDRVVGKYDLIDYAVGFERDGKVRGVEVLAYRESHGSEIRQAAWRGQFKGRQGPQALRHADDIKNISGATLSCQHVTEGVQRLSVVVGWLRPAS